MDYERLLLKHLDEIDQLVRTWGRRRHLSPAEQEDFAGFVRLRLIEDDYAVLRKFQERSTLWTYLSSVIGRLSLDYCAEQWGRWRPSAADRLGPEAVALERLVTRDGHTLDEAIAIVRAGVRTSPRRSCVQSGPNCPRRCVPSTLVKRRQQRSAGSRTRMPAWRMPRVNGRRRA